jgi:Flp pilus assembly pilin Flp
MTAPRFSTGQKDVIALGGRVEKPRPRQHIHPGPKARVASQETVMSNTALAVVEEFQARARSPRLRLVRDEVGATTAEYATVTGCGVGFAAVLFKFLTSSAGQGFLKLIFNAIKGLLPF